MSENAGTKQQKQDALPKEQAELARKWFQLVAKSRTDKTLKQRLMGAPVAVLQEHGIKVRQGLDVRVVENTDKVVYLTLPSDSQLSDKQLDGVVGGTRVVSGDSGPDLVADQTGFGEVLLTVGAAIVNTVKAILPS